MPGPGKNTTASSVVSNSVYAEWVVKSLKALCEARGVHPAPLISGLTNRPSATVLLKAVAARDGIKYSYSVRKIYGVSTSHFLHLIKFPGFNAIRYKSFTSLARQQVAHDAGVYQGYFHNSAVVSESLSDKVPEDAKGWDKFYHEHWGTPTFEDALAPFVRRWHRGIKENVPNPADRDITSFIQEHVAKKKKTNPGFMTDEQVAKFIKGASVPYGGTAPAGGAGAGGGEGPLPDDFGEDEEDEDGEEDEAPHESGVDEEGEAVVPAGGAGSGGGDAPPAAAAAPVASAPVASAPVAPASSAEPGDEVLYFRRTPGSKVVLPLTVAAALAAQYAGDDRIALSATGSRSNLYTCYVKPSDLVF